MNAELVTVEFNGRQYTENRTLSFSREIHVDGKPTKWNFYWLQLPESWGTVEGYRLAARKNDVYQGIVWMMVDPRVNTVDAIAAMFKNDSEDLRTAPADQVAGLAEDIWMRMISSDLETMSFQGVQTFGIDPVFQLTGSINGSPMPIECRLFDERNWSVGGTSLNLPSRFVVNYEMVLAVLRRRIAYQLDNEILLQSVAAQLYLRAILGIFDVGEPAA